MTCEMRLTRVLGLPAILGERLLGHVERTALEVTLGPLEDLRRGRLRVRDWAIQTASGGETQVLIERQRWEV